MASGGRNQEAGEPGIREESSIELIQLTIFLFTQIRYSPFVICHLNIPTSTDTNTFITVWRSNPFRDIFKWLLIPLVMRKIYILLFILFSLALLTSHIWSE